MSETKAATRRKGRGKGKRKSNSNAKNERKIKYKKPIAQLSPQRCIIARKRILKSISRPRRGNSMGQNKFFEEFLARLEERDKTLEQSDLEAAAEDAMNHVFDEEAGEMKLEWEVEEILDVHTVDGTRHYLVLWKGHLLLNCTWEIEGNLANATDAIENFYSAFPTKKNSGFLANQKRKRSQR